MAAPKLPSLTPSPAAPGPSDGTNFAARAYAFLNWIYTTFVSEVNDMIEAYNSASEIIDSMTTTSTSAAAMATTKASEASASATTATTKASEASTSATTASTKATEAAASAARAEDAAGNNVRGLDSEMAPSNAMLGTAAYLDQTWLYASATWDADSVATAAQTSTTVAVPGAEIGDKVFPSASIALSGLNLRGEVTAIDVVTLYLSNVTGSSVDLASATYYISVLKRTPAR